MTATFKEIGFFAFDKGAQFLFEIMRELKLLLDEKNSSITEKMFRLYLIDDSIFVMSERLDKIDTVQIEYGGLVLFLQNLGGKLVCENEEEDERLGEKFVEVGRKIIDLGDKINSKKLAGF